MARQHARRLVIDADVGGSAGESEHPVSRACRLFLEAVRKFGHHVVMTTAIWDEWRRHQSGFSQKWLVQMTGGRSVHWCDAGRDASLRSRIAGAVAVDRQPAADKDAHLIEAALSTDRLVASRDERARGIFRDAAGGVRELKPIVWVNPALPADKPVHWLENGARSEARRRLG